jgi:very-short-patch-repair endonuclease
VQQIKSYTDKQLLVESWINQLGFRTDLETVFGEYSADIFLPELLLIVEVDGPSHKFKKRDKKRDDKLRNEHGLKDVLRIPVAIKEEAFKKLFLLKVKELIGDNPFE